MNLTRFFINMGKLRQKRDAIRDSGNDRTVVFGVYAMVFAVFAVACAAGGSFLLKIGITNDNIVAIVLGFLFGVVLLIGALFLVVHAFIRVGFQFSVSHSPMGWLALLVSLAAVAGAICCVIFIALA